jgi:polar amino acid transport system substrate-binding protein
VDRRPVQPVVPAGAEELRLRHQSDLLPAGARTGGRLQRSYYDVEQAIVAVDGTPIANADSIEALKDYKLGAAIGTTSLEAINTRIEPSSEPSVYDTNNDAVSALKAKQIDGIVADLPTALYMAAVQIDNGTVVGRLAAEEGGEYFGVVLEKDSALTECVNEALGRVRDAGTLDELEQKWLGASAPILE